MPLTPTPRVRSENRIDEFRKKLERILPILEGVDDLVGITLDGGMARGFVDELSQIDVTLFLGRDGFRRLEEGRFPISTGITGMEGQLCDIKAVDFEHEMNRGWAPMELWNLSNAEILHDPEDKIRKLREEKLEGGPELATAERKMFSSWWYFKLAGDIWIQRGDPVQGSMMMNKAVIDLTKALFIANGEYVPHEKWLINLSYSLAWKPERWEVRLKSSLHPGEFEGGDLEKSQQEIEGLWEEVDERLKEMNCPDLPVKFMQRTPFRLMRWLIEEGEIDTSSWEEKAGMDMLSRDPFHPVTAVFQGRIALDRERLYSIRPSDMYSWQYKILEAARSV